MPIAHDTIVAAMDLTAVLALEELAGDGDPSDGNIAAFLSSTTAEKLYDDSLKLWWEGPSSISDRYMKELATRTKAGQ